MDFRTLNLRRDLFECDLCHYLLEEPIQCYGCTSIFCRSCLLEYVNNNSSCPNQCEDEYFDSMDPALTMLMSRINAKCKHSYCQYRGPLSSLNAHETSCTKQGRISLSSPKVDEIRQQRDISWMNSLMTHYIETASTLLTPRNGQNTPRTINRFDF